MLGNTRSGRFPKTESARARVNTGSRFFFFFAQDFGRGVFLWEKRVMIDLPIRSCVRPGFVWARRGRGFLLHRDCRFVEIRFYLHRVRRCVEIGFYLHRDCRYQLVVGGLARRRHCFCFIPDASKISSSFSCRFFLS